MQVYAFYRVFLNNLLFHLLLSQQCPKILYGTVRSDVRKSSTVCTEKSEGFSLSVLQTRAR